MVATAVMLARPVWQPIHPSSIIQQRLHDPKTGTGTGYHTGPWFSAMAGQRPVNGRPVDNNRRRHQTSSSLGAPGVDGLSTTTEDLRRALLVKAHQILTLVRRIVASCTSGEPGGGGWAGAHP